VQSGSRADDSAKMIAIMLFNQLREYRIFG